MEEHGVVVKTKGTTVMVKAQRGTSCEGCASKRTCQAIGETDMLLEVENTVGAKEGDNVVFTVAAGSVLKAGVLLYLVPLISFIAGVVLGQTLAPGLFPETNPDLLSGVIGAGFLVLTFIGLKVYGRMIERDKSYRPHVVRVV